MRGVLTFIGALICIILGIPLVIAATWAVGLASSALSDDFFPKLADEVVARIPTFIERTYEVAQEPRALVDPNAKAWVEAMQKASLSPPEMLEKSGVNGWLRDQLAPALHDVGRAVRGEIAPNGVVVDMRPLHAALAGPVVQGWAREVLSHLPPCQPAQLETWRSKLPDVAKGGPPPACHPGDEVVDKGFALMSSRASSLPEMEPLFEAKDTPPVLDFVPQSRVLVWLVFLAPLLVLVIGGIIAGRGGKGFLGWTGGSTFVGGGLALVSAWVAGEWLLPLAGWDASRFRGRFHSDVWSEDAARKLAQETLATVQDFLGPLFGDVRTVAIGVTVVGAVLLVLAAIAPHKPKPATA